MALKTMIENLNKAKAEYDAQLASLGKNAASAVAQELAKNIPPGYSLTWRQYTPYFNDGSPCKFSVHDPYLVKDGAEGRHLDDRGIYLYSVAEKYGTADQEKSYKKTRYDYRTNKQVETGEVVHYVERGFPAIEGYAKAQIDELLETWKALPEAMMESAFGDHVEVTVKPDGTHEVNEYGHD